MEKFLRDRDEPRYKRLLARLEAFRESLSKVHEAACDEEPLTGPELEQELQS